MARANRLYVSVTPIGHMPNSRSHLLSNVVPVSRPSSRMIRSPSGASLAAFPVTTRFPIAFALQRDTTGVRPGVTHSCRGLPTGSGPQLKSPEARLSVL